MPSEDMTAEDAKRFLRMSRDLRWDFPSSSGNPLKPTREFSPIIADLLGRLERVIEAIVYLNENGARQEAMELAANAWRLWLVRGEDSSEARVGLALVLDSRECPFTREHSLALYGDGLLAFRQGDIKASRERNERAVEVARVTGDGEALALAHLGLSRVAFVSGDYESARSHAQEARRKAERLGMEMQQAPLHMYAQATRLAGDLDAAALLFRESLELNRRLGDEGMVAVELHNLGHVELRRGDIDAAEGHFEECAQLAPPADAYGRAMVELNRSAIAEARGRLEEARSILQHIDELLVETGMRLAVDDQLELDRLRERAGPAE